MISLNQNIIQNYKSYLIAQLKINFWMFLFYWVSFSILSISHPLMMSILVTSCHILPIIGSSLIFIPWLGFLLFSQHFHISIFLLLIWFLGIGLKEILDNYFVGKELALPFYIPFLLTFICGIFFNIWGIVVAALTLPLVATIFQMNKNKGEYKIR